MSDLLSETVNDLLSGTRAPDTGWDPGLWARLEELGLTGVGVPEASGGAGGTLADAAVVARACGYHAAAVPFADHAFVAARALAAAGFALPEGPLAVAFAPAECVRGAGADTTVSGTLTGVPWGRHAARVVVIAPDGPAVRVALLDPAQARITEGVNAAGEPRDTLSADRAPVEAAVAHGVGIDDVRSWAALARAVAITGAARRVLDLTVRYAGEREQFGRPIGRFQAVQQELAELAGAVEQAEAMAGQAVALAADGVRDGGDAGGRGTDGGGPTGPEGDRDGGGGGGGRGVEGTGVPDVRGAETARAAAAAAKICAGRAAGIAVTTGHQVHGAIGFTQEHDLHRFTRRLLAWRDEHGAEAVWCAELGGAVAAGGAGELWRLLTSGGVDA